MPAWGWVLIGIGVVVVLALVAWQALERRRTGRLQRRFGPEYGHAIETADSRREAEAELQAREERRARLDIRPLSHAARARTSSVGRRRRRSSSTTRAEPSRRPTSSSSQ